jgi:hypothetical protein
MPRIRSFGDRGGDAAKIEILLDGGEALALLDEPVPEVSDQELEALWRAQRAVLLPQFISDHPGQRPYGWWRFDVGLNADLPGGWWRDWWVEYRELEARGLIAPEEKFRFERARFSEPSPLAGRDPVEAASALLLSAGHANLRAYSLRLQAGEMEFRGWWHEREGRAPLALSYSAVARGLSELAEIAATKVKEEEYVRTQR